MRKHSSLSVTWVSVDEIDAEDRKYAVTPGWMTVPKLQQSVQAVGLIVPLRLEKDERSKLHIISGFRRFKVAQELEIKEIPCVISPVKVPSETFLKVLWENLGCRSFSEVEKGVALQKLKSTFGFSDCRLIKELLPALELRADRYHLERYLHIARLPEMVQQAMTCGYLHTDTALGLSKWGRNEQCFFIDLVSKYQLGRNKQKALFECLRDLRAIMKTEVHSLWEQCKAKEIDEDPLLSPQDRLARINSVLKGLRYPELTQHEERFQELRGFLGIPSGVKLSVPPYFEGTQVSIRIDAASPQELRDLAGETKRLLDRNELDQIFDLL
jgi:hypothetical protein